MSNIRLNLTGMSAFNGLWFDYTRDNGYFGCAGSNNYVAVYRFTLPDGGRVKRISISFNAIKGYADAGSTVSFYASLTRTDPTAGNAYTGNYPGNDDGLIGRAATSINGLTLNLTNHTISIPLNGMLAAGQTVYLVLHPYRDAGQNFGLAYKANATATIETASLPPEAAIPVQPMGDVYSSDELLTFKWRHNDSSGLQQTGWRIYTGSEGSSPQLLAEGADEAQQYSVLASGAGNPGTKFWKVQTANEIGWGELSEAQTFTVVGATPVENLAVTGNTWRPTVKWYTSNQELAQVIIDGQSYTVFGADQFFVVPDVLQDGEHVLKVRTQNSFGIWSEASISWEASNPGLVSFSASVGVANGVVSIGVPLSQPEYVIYRNGVPIAKVQRGQSYVDFFAAGRVTYIVRAIGELGYYDYVKTLDVLPRTVTITDCDNGDFMELELSTTQTRVITTAKSHVVSASHFVGRRYPLAVASEFEEAGIDVETAFVDRSSALMFEEFAGKLVCVKTEHGDMVIGVLTDIKKAADEFIVSYSFSLAQVDFPEVIDIDTGNKL